METSILKTGSDAELSRAVERAVQLLGRGECVALPTETVYGLAADALRPDAVAKIFEAKERPFFDPLIVHLPDRAWLDRITDIPPESRALVDALTAKFWPGPLTLVLPRREGRAPAQEPDPEQRVPDLVTAGLPTVAVRMSAHPVFRAVCATFGSPLAAPSANRFGRISPTAAEHVRTELDGRIPLILDGGATQHGLESTIVKVEGGGVTILRAGPVTAENLLDHAMFVRSAVAADRPDAPGQLKSHYAPRTRLRLLPRRVGVPPAGLGVPPERSFQGWNPPTAIGEAATQDASLGGRDAHPTREDAHPARDGDARAGLLAWREVAEPHRFAAVEILSATGDLREAAATLFAKMRRLDEAGLDLILAEPVPEHGLGIAIMDRLRKAAAEHAT